MSINSILGLAFFAIGISSCLVGFILFFVNGIKSLRNWLIFSIGVSFIFAVFILTPEFNQVWVEAFFKLFIGVTGGISTIFGAEKYKEEYSKVIFMSIGLFLIILALIFLIASTEPVSEIEKVETQKSIEYQELKMFYREVNSDGTYKIKGLIMVAKEDQVFEVIIGPASDLAILGESAKHMLAKGNKAVYYGFAVTDSVRYIPEPYQNKFFYNFNF